MIGWIHKLETVHGHDCMMDTFVACANINRNPINKCSCAIFHDVFV